MASKKQARLNKQETKKRKLGLLSRRFKNISGPISGATELVLDNLKPDVNHFENKSEEFTPYPSEWAKKETAIVQSVKKLYTLWLELFLYPEPEEPQSPQASSSGDG